MTTVTKNAELIQDVFAELIMQAKQNITRAVEAGGETDAAYLLRHYANALDWASTKTLAEINDNIASIVNILNTEVSYGSPLDIRAGQTTLDALHVASTLKKLDQGGW